MSVLRFIARSLFASTFIADGVRKVTSPADATPQTDRLISRVAPVVQRVVPSRYSSHVPENPETWVRLCGTAEIAGGLLFATGLGRRFGALLLSGASLSNLMTALPSKDADEDDKQARQPEVLTRAALLGASVLATQDLQGRPSVAWRRKNAARRRKTRSQAVSS